MFLLADKLGTMVKCCLGKVSCKTIPAIAGNCVFTIQPASKSDAVQVVPLLLGHIVTGILSRSASDLANCIDRVQSFTAARIRLDTINLFQEGAASAAMMLIIETTTISSMSVKP